MGLKIKNKTSFISVMSELLCFSNSLTCSCILVSILLPDWPSCLVIMTRTEYISKVMQFLESDDFEKVNKDPTLPYFKKLKSSLEQAALPLKYYNKSKCSHYPMNLSTPQLYGLQKIHKFDHPIRPVVFVSSPCYYLSLWLNQVLPKKAQFVKNVTSRMVSFWRPLM